MAWRLSMKWKTVHTEGQKSFLSFFMDCVNLFANLKPRLTKRHALQADTDGHTKLRLSSSKCIFTLLRLFTPKLSCVVIIALVAVELGNSLFRWIRCLIRKRLGEILFGTYYALVAGVGTVELASFCSKLPATSTDTSFACFCFCFSIAFSQYFNHSKRSGPRLETGNSHEQGTPK